MQSMKGTFFRGRVRTLLLFITLTLPAVAWSYPDESFYKALMESGISELGTANLALQKSSNDKVKEFAALMVKDHTALNDGLKTLAASRRARLPSSASATQRAIEAKLALLSSRGFDQFYIRAQIDAHQDLLDLVNSEMTSGKDPKAKAFAGEILSTVQAHLKMIRVLAAGEGV
jgi:putative membrane protein